jgi:ABC-2 type transport system ATP-binding protein
MNNVITFERVSKKFKKGPLLLKEALVEVFKTQKSREFWALKDINFTVKAGESIGILGPNGSGKSTLLKLLAGVMQPTEGSVTVVGRIAPLIELGAGFHHELTGRENIYINGAILGLKRAEIEAQLSDIIDFAELEDFIDAPVKHYSSGMFMRLGFSVAVHVKPQILLIDEILAVGDQKFKEKCYARMREFQEQQVTMVLVTHSPGLIEEFCQKGLVLAPGKQVFVGQTGEAVRIYREMMK